jgi:hypothetical protein
MTTNSLGSLNVITAISSMIGYCQSLKPGTVITEGYMERMNDYYIPKIQDALATCKEHLQVQSGDISVVVPDEGPFPPSSLDDFAGCPIDELDTKISYNLTGTHLKQFFQSYRTLYRHWEHRT